MVFRSAFISAPICTRAILPTSQRIRLISMAHHENKSPDRVAAGLKAAIHNPNVSAEAKERAYEKLDDMGIASDTTVTHENRVLGGYKATLNNTRTSSQAKQHAREVLEAAGYGIERDPSIPEDEHDKRIIAGYKAALHNPRVSKEAKQHAKDFLEEVGAL